MPKVKHERPYLTHNDKQRVTARFSTGLVRSQWTAAYPRSHAWLFQYVKDGELCNVYGFAHGEASARKAIKSTVTRMKTVVKVYQEIVETDDGARDTDVNLCRYLEVQTPPTAHHSPCGHWNEVDPAWAEAAAKGKRFLIVGETDKAYFIVILGSEYKVLKSGARRLTICGCYGPGKPWKGSPEFRHYGQHSDRAKSAAKRAAEHEARYLLLSGVDTEAKDSNNLPNETETKWNN